MSLITSPSPSASAERRRAGAVDARGNVDERVAQLGQRTGRAPPRDRAVHRRARRTRRARASSTPRRSSSASSTSVPSAPKSTCWQRDRMVGSSSAADSATRMMIVRGGGSSMLLSNVFDDSGLSRSASSRTTHLRSVSTGLACTAGRIASRTSRSTEYGVATGRNSTTSGCRPRSTRSSPSAPISERGEAAGRDLDPRAPGPDEQVGVDRTFGGALQHRHRAVLTDHLLPHGGRA